MNELQRKFDEHNTHLFCPGRAFGFRAADDFAVGFNKLSANDEKRIRDFVDRTCREFGRAPALPSENDKDEESEDDGEGAGRFRDVRPNYKENAVVRPGDE